MKNFNVEIPAGDLNVFEWELVRKFGMMYLDVVGSATIGIAGAGGLGSNCAVNLLRCGFKKFLIGDYDVVEYSNLDRQFYFMDQVGQIKVEALKTNLLRIHKAVQIDISRLRITRQNVKETFSNCEIIVEAFDGAEDKKMLVESFAGSGKFIVSASGLAGIGDTDSIKTHRVKDNLVVVGDLTSDILKRPPVSPRVNVAAAKQADAVLEHVLKRGGFDISQIDNVRRGGGQ